MPLAAWLNSVQLMASAEPRQHAAVGVLKFPARRRGAFSISDSPSSPPPVLRNMPEDEFGDKEFGFEISCIQTREMESSMGNKGA